MSGRRRGETPPVAEVPREYVEARRRFPWPEVIAAVCGVAIIGILFWLVMEHR